jgi:hypothetical protein
MDICFVPANKEASSDENKATSLSCIFPLREKKTFSICISSHSLPKAIRLNSNI